MQQAQFRSGFRRLFLDDPFLVFTFRVDGLSKTKLKRRNMLAENHWARRDDIHRETRGRLEKLARLQPELRIESSS